MNGFSEVTVVGAGPCGSFAALNLAKHGVKVTVFEEHKEIGVPTHCAGHLSIKNLKRLGLDSLPKGIIENSFKGAVIHAPYNTELTVKFNSPVTCTVNRALFDKYIARLAEKAGANYMLNSRVKSLKIKGKKVEGVILQNKQVFSSKIVIDAEGISARLLKQAGLPSNNRMVVKSVQIEVENVKNVNLDLVEVFLGNNYAPGFYAWLIPKRDGKAKVGLAVSRGNPENYLQKLIHKHPKASEKLGTTKILQKSFHSISLGGPISKPYSNGFLVVGDAASQVKPTTGGGLILGMTCAKIAAKTAFEALKRNNFSSSFLRKYKQICDENLGLDFSVMLKIRKLLNSLSDRKIEETIRFFKRMSLEKTFQKIEDIDFQGRSLLKILWKPRMSLALIYLILTFLSNP